MPCQGGSSPRVWGQAAGGVAQAARAGIIPTRMGTSCPSQPRRCKVWDHPHAYGDKVTTVPPLASVRGSSPRVWGQVCCANVPPYIFGIIPTRMGTRVVTSVLSLSLRDHPHAYGDKSFNYSPTAHIQGSSPRVWGQEVSVGLGGTNYWIIPTRMGTSFMQVAIDFAYRDHPHVKSNMVYTLCKHMVYMLSITNEHKNELEMRAKPEWKVHFLCFASAKRGSFSIR